MRIQPLAAVALVGALAPLSLAACALDVPDLNNPSLDDLRNHPNAISIGAACTGLLIGNRGNVAAENGYVSELGILGREAYNFDAADPRYVSELLVGKLNSAGFGGNFWAGPYANLQLGNVVLSVVDKVADLPDSAKSGIRGFTKTIEALDLLRVVITHDTNGAVLDVNPDPLAPPSPIVRDPVAQYARITGLLDDAVNDLKAGGDAFPFALSKGFANFDTPATFLTFNRAIRARVAVYAGDYRTAMSVFVPTDPNQKSFLDDNPATLDFNAGVYYAYSTKPEDTANALINPNIFVHPSIETGAAKDMMGNLDARFSRKTVLAPTPPGRRDATRTFKPLYPNPEASVPLIRNEELILLKAEALFKTGDAAGAVAELNIVRTLSGRLDPIPVAPLPDDATFTSELLYERTYSLLFEGGHRWIDARRLDQLSTLPIFITVDKDTGKMTPDTLNVRYPIPVAECNARPQAEPACMLGSTDG